MNILTQFFERRVKIFENYSIDSLVKSIRKELVRQDKVVKNDKKLMDSLLENVLIKVINTRCTDISLTSSYIKNENMLKIKLFGENNYLYENSKWAELIKDKKLNEDLKIYEDLYFSDSHLFFIFKEYFNFFEVDDSVINDMIIPLIKESQFKTIGDLKATLNKIFIEDNFNKRI